MCVLACMHVTVCTSAYAHTIISFDVIMINYSISFTLKTMFYYYPICTINYRNNMTASTSKIRPISIVGIKKSKALIISMLARLVPIMLLKLPIMLWSNAPEFCLLCSNYAPYINHFAPQIQHFLSLILQHYEYKQSF